MIESTAFDYLFFHTATTMGCILFLNFVNLALNCLIRRKRKTIFVTIEGNIGSGKSTLLVHLKEFFKKQKNIRIGYIDEPIDEWNEIKDSEGKTVLEKYYKEQEKYAFAFQMMAYISRLVNIKKSLNLDCDIIIMERSMITDREVFAKMLFDEKKMEDVEYTIYNKWFDAFIGELPELFYIYVKTTPDISLKRLNTRKRQGESCIPLEYLTKCNEYHDKWLDNIPNCKILKINADDDFDEVRYNKVCEEAFGFMKTSRESI